MAPPEVIVLSDTPPSPSPRRRRVTMPSVIEISSRSPSPARSDGSVEVVAHISRRKRRRTLSSPGPAATSPAPPQRQSSPDLHADDDVTVTATRRGVDALKDYPHFRFQCGQHKFPGATGPFPVSRGCKLCFCYLCDRPASECSKWATHSLADDKRITFRAIRKKMQDARRGSRPTSRQTRLPMAYSRFSHTPQYSHHVAQPTTTALPIITPQTPVLDHHYPQHQTIALGPISSATHATMERIKSRVAAHLAKKTATSRHKDAPTLNHVPTLSSIPRLPRTEELLAMAPDAMIPRRHSTEETPSVPCDVCSPRRRYSDEENSPVPHDVLIPRCRRRTRTAIAAHRRPSTLGNTTDVPSLEPPREKRKRRKA